MFLKNFPGNLGFFYLKTNEIERLKELLKNVNDVEKRIGMSKCFTNQSDL